MPKGDAAKIHRHVGQLARNARANGEGVIVFRVGDIRNALRLNYSDAAIDICQVMETKKKFPRENGVSLVGKSGPNQGVDTEYTFRIR